MKTKKVKYMPTKKLKEILNHPYLQGSDGVDYWNYEEEMQEALAQRYERDDDRLMREYERYINTISNNISKMRGVE